MSQDSWQLRLLTIFWKLSRNSSIIGCREILGKKFLFVTRSVIWRLQLLFYIHFWNPGWNLNLLRNWEYSLQMLCPLPKWRGLPGFESRVRHGCQTDRPWPHQWLNSKTSWQEVSGSFLGRACQLSRSEPCEFLRNSLQYGLGSHRKTPKEDTPPLRLGSSTDNRY